MIKGKMKRSLACRRKHQREDECRPSDRKQHQGTDAQRHSALEPALPGGQRQPHADDERTECQQECQEIQVRKPAPAFTGQEKRRQGRRKEQLRNAPEHPQPFPLHNRPRRDRGGQKNIQAAAHPLFNQARGRAHGEQQQAKIDLKNDS